ncbi:hypothetical protein C2S53_007940 [Perilla frutescens var. hirtella]|uniref:Uncharacterized protein n=1 Tax=Perilla frutescens var. hirtella TaxID=608512 RepID=A0AAD4P828_PERFH|nr:hypothetical protein C2S53_007940 [Perilla frutescens var. hirtella]
MADDIILNDLEESMKKSEHKLQAEILKREAWELRLQKQIIEQFGGMNEKLDQLGDAIAVLQRQIVIRFGKENQSSPSSFTPTKPYVATSIDAPLLNSLSTPVPEFDHYQTQFEPLEQKPKATSILMLDYKDENGFADVQNNSKLYLTPSCKDLVKHPNSDLKVARLTEIVGTKLGFGVEENELDDALIKRWIGLELGHVAGVDFSEDEVVINEHNVFEKIPQPEIGIYSREGAGSLITPRPLPKPPPS